MPTEPLIHKQASTKSPVSLTGWAIRSLCALGCLIIVEALFSGTALITPITQTLVYGLWAAGLLVGLAASVCIVRLDSKTFGSYHKMIMIIYALGVFWACSDGFAWRITDRLAFGFFHQAPFTSAIYPVTDSNKPWKGARANVEINPFGLRLGVPIPIPQSQYKEIQADYAGLCVKVLQRRSAMGAIHIRTNGRYTAFEPKPVELSVCPVDLASPQNQ
jgi:hypothetical protein